VPLKSFESFEFCGMILQRNGFMIQNGFFIRRKANLILSAGKEEVRLTMIPLLENEEDGKVKERNIVLRRNLAKFIILSKTKSCCIPKFYGWFRNIVNGCNCFCVISELFKKDLEDFYLTKSFGEKFLYTNKMKIVVDLVNSIKIIHDLQLYMNVLLYPDYISILETDNSLDIKFSEIGILFSSLEEGNSRTQSYSDWTRLSLDSSDTETNLFQKQQMDIYKLGILICSILLEHPISYPHLKNTDDIHRYIVELIDRLENEKWRIILTMCLSHSNDRPTIDKLIEHIKKIKL
jgi:hypothetical protein